MTETSGLDLQRIIEDSIRSARDLAVEIPVKVVAEYPAHLPSVEIMRGELTGILTSLITHILFNTVRDEVKVCARLISAKDMQSMESIPEGSRPAAVLSGPWVSMEITDTSAECLQLTTDMYIDATVPEMSRDLGILSISQCRDLVEEAGGTLWVEHQPDVGSRCSLLLALHASRKVSHDLSILYRAVEPHVPDQKDAGKTLLLLTDNTDLQTTLPVDLIEGGYRVLTTGDSAEFFELIRREKAELLLLDIDHRDPPAFDIAALLKSDTAAGKIPILFLTVMSDAEGKTHIGAVDFLSRPVGTGKLLSIVNDFLEKRQKPYGRVLVIEPEEAIRSSLVMMIRSRGDRVTEAAGPEEALVLAERFSPGMILINANTAHERDYWLLRQLRMLSPDIEILVLADRFSELESQEVLNRGASGYGETGKLPDLLDHSN